MATTDQPFTLSVTNPVCHLTVPSDGATFAPAPASVTLTATASSTNGISQVEFYNGATLVGTDTSSPYSVSWQNVAAGTYTLHARAYDAVSGAIDSDNTATITVLPSLATPTPPARILLAPGGISNPTPTPTPTPTPSGIAAGYPQDSGIAAHADVIIADNFESYTGGISGSTFDSAIVAHGWTNLTGNTLSSVSTSEHFAGSKSIKMSLPVSASEISSSVILNTPADTNVLFVRLYEKWASDYANTASNHNGTAIKGGTITAGQPVNPDGTEAFTFLLENNSANRAFKDHVYSYWPYMAGNFGDHLYPDGSLDGGQALWLTNPSSYPGFTPMPMHTPNLNQWYCYEFMVRLNDVGQSNGEVKWWVDGVLTGDFTNLFIRGTNTLDIEQMYFNLHTTSQTGQALTKYYDNVVVAKSYIGPMAP